MIVVADATPLRYLILIEAIDILPALYGRVCVLMIVADELQRSRTPTLVRQWMAAAPAWLDIQTPSSPPERALSRLGAGEREAIVLAQTLRADLLVMDDWDGREAARLLTPGAGGRPVIMVYVV